MPRSRIALFLGACCLVWQQPILSAEDAPMSPESKELRQIFDETWQFNLEEDPLLATHVGEHRFNDRLPHASLADIARRNQRWREFLDRLQKIPSEKLSRVDQINQEILAWDLQTGLAEYDLQGHLLPITNREGFHISFPELRRNMPLKSIKDYENYLARLEAFPQYVQEHVELLKRGMELGFTLPAVVMNHFEDPIRAHIVTDCRKSLFFEPFRDFPEDFPESQRQRLAARAEKVILERVVPGYQTFLDFMSQQYVPRCRDTIGAFALPDGRGYYNHCIRKFTTLDLSPEQIHEIGQSEVTRIKTEMQEVIKKSGFAGDFSAFVEHLRNDPKFYAKTPDELMKEVAYILKRMDGELPRLFGRLPRTPYGIREIPSYIAPLTTSAYYQVASGDGKVAGYYYVNTYNLKMRPLYDMEALSLHEAVPGHHLQLALQQELTDVPNFRRYGSFTAYVEGWALYAERLGLDVGFYADPYSDFGRLNFEMWRACRLVVDTGMHALGWTRDQAIEFMLQNTALSDHNIRAEVDRYISWPGQALAYKLGELKIRELRQRAEEKLGDRFDVRAFHDAVLSQGSIPLNVLEREIDAYIEQASRKP